MKKGGRKGRTALIVLISCAAVFLAANALYASRYRETFIEGTFINGIDAGNLTGAEVESAIRSRVEDYSIGIVFPDGKKETISGADFGYSYEPDKGVMTLLADQNRYSWLFGKLGMSSSYTVGEGYSFDPAGLDAAVMALPEMDAATRITPQNAYIALGADDSLMIVPEVNGNELNADVVLAAVRTAVETGKDEIDLRNIPEAARLAEIRSDNEALQSELADLNGWLDTTVTWNMYDGTTVVLDRHTTSSWLTPKEDRSGYILDENAVAQSITDYMRGMAGKYDKVSTQATFNSTNQGQVTIETERTGHLVDESEEAVELQRILAERTSVEREPIYALNTPLVTSVSGTYIEVDISAQHVYFYRDGSMLLDTPCVTGLASDPSRRTPRGLFSIIEKDTSRTLRGEINPSTGRPSYESFVNYWMRVYEGVGLHDAPWRSSFGGGIYQSSGSHGCINLPYSAAQTLYSLCEYGDTVVII